MSLGFANVICVFAGVHACCTSEKQEPQLL